MGVKKGDHVAIWATNVPQWYITFWATTKIGAVLVTMNTEYRIHEAEYLLRQSDTMTLVMIDGIKNINYVDIIKELCPELEKCKPGQLRSPKLPFLRNVITIDSKNNGCYTWEEACELAETIPYSEVEIVRRTIDIHDVCNMQYTSGTTGFPKGVMLTHYNVVNNGKAIGDCMDLSTADRMMIQVPMFHCFGMVLAMTASMTHGTTMSPITRFSPRKGLAQVFYNVFDRIGTSLEPLDNRFTGSFGLAADGLAPQTEITGDLLLCNEVPELLLEGVTVTGRLVIQGNGPLQLKLTDCSVGELVLCRPTTLELQGGSVSSLSVVAPSTLSAGSVENLFAWADVELGPEASVGSLGLQEKQLHCVVNGQLGTLVVNGKNCSLAGSGSVEKIIILAPGFQGSCAQEGSREEQIDPGVTAIAAVRTDSGKANGTQPILTLGLRLSNMPAGQQDCSVKWYIENSLIHSQRLLLSEGSVITADADLGSYILKGYSSVNVTVTIRSDGKIFTYTGTIALEGGTAAAAQLVRTQAIQATIKEDAVIYRFYNVYSKTFATELGMVEAGTQVTILKTSNGIAAQITLPDGRDVWTDYSAIQIISGTYYTTEDYPKEVKEFFINYIRSRSSETQYLIWVSLWTQRVNIFQGYEGHWKLIRSGPCATGANSTPSPVEDAKVRWTSARWEYSAFYVHHVTLFDESRAFHSRPTRYEDDGVYSYAMGYPCSNGCIRLLDEDCIWIYENIPAGTAVILY